MRFQIENPIDRDFGMVPRGLWQMDLPFAAKAVAAYLFCLRDGAVPYVAEIEAQTGIGRDARKKAFAQLEAAGVIRWQVQRNASGTICGKTLLINASACGHHRATENQADGENHRAPEKPSDGQSVDASTETRRWIDCGSGDTLKEKKERAASARAKSVQRVVARAAGRSDRRGHGRKADAAQVAAAHAALSHPATSEKEKAQIWDWLDKVQPIHAAAVHADP